MLTTAAPGQRLRQWLFIALLFVPLFGLMFVNGVFIGRITASAALPMVLTGAIVGTIAAVIVFGLNYRIGIYLILLMVMWDRMQTFGPGGAYSATKISIAITIIFLVAAILANQVRGWTAKLGDPLIILGVLYLFVSVVGMPFMPYPELAVPFVQRRLNVVSLMAVLIIAVSDREIFHRCILCLVISGAAIAVATLSEVFTGTPLLARIGKSIPETELNVFGAHRGKIRVIGPAGGSTFHGLAQTLPGILAFGLLFYYRKMWQKVLLAGAVTVIAFNIVASGSRGPALGFALAALIVFLACPIRYRLAKVTIVSVIALAALTAVAASDIDVAAQRVAAPMEATRTLEYRISMNRMALNMFLDNPVVGVGTSGWALHYHFYREPLAPSSGLRVHNAFMQLLAENGLQGVLVYVLMYVFAAGSAFCAALATRDRRLKFESMALASTTFGFFVFAGTSNVLENELYFILFGLCAAAYHVYRRETQVNEIPEHDRLDVSGQRAEPQTSQVAAAGV